MPICGWRLRRLRTSTGPFPAPDSVCPGCGSLERHRLLWLYLRERGDLFAERLRVLHVAPEPGLERRLRARPNLDYLSIDLDPAAAMAAADLEHLPFADRSFDRVLCVHVLEHVDDDAAALSELHRVLAPGGEAIVMVPLLGPTTDEDRLPRGRSGCGASGRRIMCACTAPTCATASRPRASRHAWTTWARDSVPIASAATA